VEITDSDGLDTSVYQLALDALDRHDDIEAVYSIGGGNRAILDAFDARQRPCRAFIAHDLDRDNREHPAGYAGLAIFTNGGGKPQPSGDAACIRCHSCHDADDCVSPHP
jgi:hypothetical protein